MTKGLPDGQEVTLEGRGLHTGEPARVILRPRPGPVTLRAGGEEEQVQRLRVVDVHRGTTVELAGRRVRTVEHLFAACAGLAIHRGLLITVDGPELPLLDGGAQAWCVALDSLSLPRGCPRLRVVRDGTIDSGPSRYRFAVGDGLRVHVLVDFDDARLSPEAVWDGDGASFRARLAGARTFAFARDLPALAEAGLASHAPPASAVVLAPDAIHSSGAPFAADEPARHKLLDLLGDLYLYGGPPLGSLRAERPGHAVTHAVMREALAAGIVAVT